MQLRILQMSSVGPYGTVVLFHGPVDVPEEGKSVRFFISSAMEDGPAEMVYMPKNTTKARALALFSYFVLGAKWAEGAIG